jgi:hypothetical protein
MGHGAFYQQKTALQITQCVTEMNLNIKSAYICSDDGWCFDGKCKMLANNPMHAEHEVCSVLVRSHFSVVYAWHVSYLLAYH